MSPIDLLALAFFCVAALLLLARGFRSPTPPPVDGGTRLESIGELDEQIEVQARLERMIAEARANTARGVHTPIPDLVRNAAQRMPLPPADWRRLRSSIIAAAADFNSALEKRRV